MQNLTEQREREIWDCYFEEALEGKGQEHDQSPWWQLLDADLVSIVRQFFSEGKELSVLEAGCGSGGTSYMLSRCMPLNHLVLFDISPKALAFAQELKGQQCSAKEVEFIEGSIFDLYQIKKQFDLVWNVGLIEHYPTQQITEIVAQMWKTTKPGGLLFIAMPNRYSVATAKAALLGTCFGKQYLSWIKGYRNTTENLYPNRTISQLIARVTNASVHIHFAGSPLWVGAPNPLVSLCNRFFPFKSLNFLTCFTVCKPLYHNN